MMLLLAASANVAGPDVALALIFGSCVLVTLATMALRGRLARPPVAEAFLPTVADWEPERDCPGDAP